MTKLQVAAEKNEKNEAPSTISRRCQTPSSEDSEMLLWKGSKKIEKKLIYDIFIIKGGGVSPAIKLFFFQNRIKSNL